MCLLLRVASIFTRAQQSTWTLWIWFKDTQPSPEAYFMARDTTILSFDQAHVLRVQGTIRHDSNPCSRSCLGWDMFNVVSSYKSCRYINPVNSIPSAILSITPSDRIEYFLFVRSHSTHQLTLGSRSSSGRRKMQQKPRRINSK
jgi:hypothetical protein